MLQPTESNNIMEISNQEDENKDLAALDSLKLDCEKFADEYEKKKEKFLVPQKIVIKNDAEDKKQTEIEENPLKEVYDKSTEEGEEKSEEGPKEEPDNKQQEIVNKLLNAVDAQVENGDEEEEDPDEYLRKLEEGH